MITQRSIDVYQFDDLSDKAKQRARDRYREHMLDYDWWDSVYEDAERVAVILGITLKTRKVGTRKDGTTISASCIFFSGFSSQGDGACIEGRYTDNPTMVADLAEYAPIDKVLANIATDLASVQARYQHGIVSEMTHRDRYYHDRSVEFDTFAEHPETGDPLMLAEEDRETVEDALRAFMRWIYKQLEAQYDWLQADEQVDESIRTNECEFDAEGGTL